MKDNFTIDNYEVRILNFENKVKRIDKAQFFVFAAENIKF